MAPGPLEELYDQTFPRVWRALGRLGVTIREDREDFAQDVYLVAHEKLATRNPDVPEVAWLLTIAANLVKNYRARLRTRKEKPMGDHDAESEVAADADAPDETVAQRRRYLALVGKLSAERRLVFELHEVEGFSVRKIAETLDLPEGTVSTRLRLARQDLEAEAARMAAREQHRGVAAAALPLLLPFGEGGWAQVRDLFDDDSGGAEQAVWRGVSRTLARAALLAGAGAGGAAAGTVLAAKTSAGVLFGSGFALGGVVVGGLLILLQPFAPKAPPAYAVPEPSRPVAVAAGVTATAPGPTQAPVPAEPIASASPASTAPVIVRVPAPATATATVAASQIDPEEMALISRAQVAFGRKDRAGTLEALDAHARKFPRGKLAPEREAIRAKLGDVVGSWAGGTTNNPVAPDAGRGRVFGSDD